MDSALLIVDLQNDFMPDGPLPVPEADRLAPLINRLQSRFSVVLATQDWHPADHGSFASNHDGHQPFDVIELNGLQQTLWPSHCVQDTPGAEFVATLDRQRIARVFRKGIDPGIDSYSGFYDNGHRKSTGLGNYLHDADIEQVHIVGVATDVCVKFTALDAASLGFQTWLIEDATRGVDLAPGDVAAAIDEMRAAGVAVTDSSQVLQYR